VIPAYRAERLIQRSVESALRQSWTDLEIVVASDDGVDYARLLRGAGVDDPRLRCVFTGGVGLGAAAARNAGLADAVAPVVATLDADDRIEPDALAILAPLALEHGAAYSRPRFVDEVSGTELASLDRPIPTGQASLGDILTSQVHTFAGIVFDRRRVRARWSDWIRRWEDTHFYARCFDDIDSLYHVAEPLYVYHRVPGSVCNRPETGHEYLDWTRRLLDMLDSGHDIDIAKPASRELFRRFLIGRHRIEAEFVDSLARGACRDFQEFIAHRLDLLHQLPGSNQ
jgi:glycosyltransferase involved in cell wall biosynthesis